MLLAVAVAAIAIEAPTGAYPESGRTWHPFRSDAGRFSILMPGAPVVTTTSRFTLLGRVNETKYLALHNGAHFGLEYYDVPRLATFFLSTETIFDMVKEGLLEDTGGEELRYEESSLQGYPARLFTYQVPGTPAFVEEVMLVIVANRIYNLSLGGPPEGASNSSLETYFQSFTVRSR